MHFFLPLACLVYLTMGAPIPKEVGRRTMVFTLMAIDSPAPEKTIDNAVFFCEVNVHHYLPDSLELMLANSTSFGIAAGVTTGKIVPRKIEKDKGNHDDKINDADHNGHLGLGGNPGEGWGKRKGDHGQACSAKNNLTDTLNCADSKNVTVINDVSEEDSGK